MGRPVTSTEMAALGRRGWLGKAADKCILWIKKGAQFLQRAGTNSLAVFQNTWAYITTKPFTFEMKKKNNSGLAEEVKRLQRHAAETEAQLKQVEEELESLRASTASTIKLPGAKSKEPSAIPSEVADPEPAKGGHRKAASKFKNVIRAAATKAWAATRLLSRKSSTFEVTVGALERIKEPMDWENLKIDWF